MDLEPKVNSDPRRNLPSVDRLIRDVQLAAPDLADWAVRRAARETLEALRSQVPPGDSTQGDSSKNLDELIERVSAVAARLAAPHPRPVVNATGVLLHTNLGRAPLAEAAAKAVARSLDGYSNLELDLETGRRGSRMGGLEAKLLALSGAEAAHVVNNNAAAVLLALNTLALGRKVVVSRGELVEIGGSFRVPAIMERAGVELTEVGTTNRTHLADYEAAIGPDTALLLKVHRSNFEQRGFVAEADVRELAKLAHARGIPFVEDLGSGTLLDFGPNSKFQEACANLQESRATLKEVHSASQQADASSRNPYALPEEAYAPSRLALGIDVICFSGDKLLGGPQAGILLGKREYIDAMRRNPLARALRVDKLTLAALDATLDLMLEEGRAHEVPVVAGLRTRAEELEPRAARLLALISPLINGRFEARVAESEAAVGGGSLPEHRLPGFAVVLEGPAVAKIAARLREAPTPVLARVRDDSLWFDVRTLREVDLPRVSDALAFALS